MATAPSCFPKAAQGHDWPELNWQERLRPASGARQPPAGGSAPCGHKRRIAAQPTSLISCAGGLESQSLAALSEAPPPVAAAAPPLLLAAHTQMPRLGALLPALLALLLAAAPSRGAKVQVRRPRQLLGLSIRALPSMAGRQAGSASPRPTPTTTAAAAAATFPLCCRRSGTSRATLSTFPLARPTRPM